MTVTRGRRQTRYDLDPADCGRCQGTDLPVPVQIGGLLLSGDGGFIPLEMSPAEQVVSHRIRHHLLHRQRLYAAQHPHRARLRRLLRRQPGQVTT